LFFKKDINLHPAQFIQTPCAEIKERHEKSTHKFDIKAVSRVNNIIIFFSI